ncbi:MAG: L,D-transpeptidase family protein [Rhodothermaceae bacterium]|nr:L,D-transpeptidase family protein [Rhodothermaceae bacterium]
MRPRPIRLFAHGTLALSLLLGGGLLGDGFFGLFGSRDAVDRDAVQTALQTRWQATDQLGRLSVEGERRAVNPYTGVLYEMRAFVPLWRDNASRETLVARLAEAPHEGVAPEQVYTEAIAHLRRALAALNAQERDEDEPDPRPAILADLDLLLTDGILHYADVLTGRRVEPKALYGDHWYPSPRPDAREVFAALEDGDADAVVEALDALQPDHPEYSALTEALVRLHKAAPRWAPIPEGAPLRVGEASVRVPYLRSRLATLGYLDADVNGWSADRPYRLDAELAGALARFQADRNLIADSTLSDTVLPALNVNPDSLIRTVELNLERWRWLGPDLGSLHVMANLPAFELTVRNRAPEGGWREALRMPAAIGTAQTAGWTTPVLTDTIEAVVAHPSWYLPASLQATSVFPLARAEGGASLTARGFRVSLAGVPIDPASVDWEVAVPGQFQIMQLPGRNNPLGRLKFVMPNHHAVLIHDTNKPWHFDRDRRTLSSGCVQASDAPALARTILRFANGWPDETIENALARGYEQRFGLNREVLVHFVYFTAWPEADGRLRLYEDVYGHDAVLREALAPAS